MVDDKQSYWNFSCHFPHRILQTVKGQSIRKNNQVVNHHWTKCLTSSVSEIEVWSINRYRILRTWTHLEWETVTVRLEKVTTRTITAAT